MEEKNLICICCPLGCPLTVALENGEVVSVTGNTCPKGAKYAVEECTHPVRTVTSTVRVTNRKDTMVSVKTAAPVPKEHLFDVMAVIRSLHAAAPVQIGDVLAENVFGTEIIANKNVK